MPTTTKHAIAYPSGSVAPNVPVVMQTQAESVDAALTALGAKIRHAQFGGASATSNAGAGAALGALSAQSASTFNNTFCTASSNNVTFTEAGVYLITLSIIPTASPGNLHLWALLNTENVLSEQQITYGSNTHTASFTAYVSANQSIGFGITSSNTVTFTSVVKITKVAG